MKYNLRVILFIVLLLIFSVNFKTAEAVETENVLKLREGAFVKVMALDEISTLTADIDDEVKFINTQDMYIYETNAIPENTIFYGTIEDVREPVEGTDGALKISVHKMITPDKKVYNLKGHLYGEKDNYIGGKLTQSAYYHKVPHYSSGLKPMLQAAPLNIYQMGKHTVIMPGAELFLILEKDVILK